MQVGIIGAPLALGQKHDGVELAPQALRTAGLIDTLEALHYSVHDYGDLALPVRASAGSPTRPYFADLVAQANKQIACQVADALYEEQIALTLGGDHSISLGTVCGVLHTKPDTVVLWIDAHGDINTPLTSPSGNVHGMVLAALLGMIDEPLQLGPCIGPEGVGWIGVRDLDPEERVLLRRMHRRVGTMHDIDRDGIYTTYRRIMDTLDPEGTRPIHVSFDIDSLDPSLTPATGCPVHGGLSFREARFLLELIAETGRLCAFDVVEINPLLEGSQQTVELAIELIAVAFGRRIM